MLSHPTQLSIYPAPGLRAMLPNQVKQVASFRNAEREATQVSDPSPMSNAVRGEPSRGPCGRSCGPVALNAAQIAPKSMIQLVGAGRFERPTPCAQGSRIPCDEILRLASNCDER